MIIMYMLSGFYLLGGGGGGEGELPPKISDSYSTTCTPK